MTAKNNPFNKLPEDKKVEFAAEMVIMDAIEKGHTNKNELIAYMQSETFKKAAVNYVKMMQ